MKLFPTGHATHPQWRMAAALVLAQLRAAAPLRPMGDAGRHSRDVVGLPLFEPTLL